MRFRTMEIIVSKRRKNKYVFFKISEKWSLTIQQIFQNLIHWKVTFHEKKEEHDLFFLNMTLCWARFWKILFLFQLGDKPAESSKNAGAISKSVALSREVNRAARALVMESNKLITEDVLTLTKTYPACNALIEQQEIRIHNLWA